MKSINKLLLKLGNTLVKFSSTGAVAYPDVKEDEFWDAYQLCRQYTMTSVERMYALYRAVLYTIENNLPGDFVECGVWRGGSAMLIARVLHSRGLTNRKIYLYDTFEGMSEPTSHDVNVFGKNARNLMDESDPAKASSVWCLADLADVKRNMGLTRLPETQIVYVQGKVEETIPMTMPTQIALLRLDTDWYESTKHELMHLYPRLVSKGIFIIDDYGHWQGCRKAVDEYFKEHQLHPLFLRIDYTGRVGIKPA